MSNAMPPQPDDLAGVVAAVIVLVICCLSVVAMLRSRRPDSKLLLLGRLISASERHSRTRPVDSIAQRPRADT